MKDLDIDIQNATVNLQDFKLLLNTLEGMELGQREIDILADLSRVEINHEVPKGYLCFELYDRAGYCFQATFRGGKLDITN